MDALFGDGISGVCNIDGIWSDDIYADGHSATDPNNY